MDEPSILFGLAHLQEGHISPGCRQESSGRSSSPTALSVGGPACLPDEAQVTCLLPLLGPESLPPGSHMGPAWRAGERLSPITFMMDRGRLGPWDLTA